MVVVGELVVSAVVKELVSKLGSELWSELELLCCFKDDLKEMKNTLSSVQAVLNDAEKQSLSNESVSLWLKRLKVAAYKIEDMLDKFRTQNKYLYFPVMAYKLKVMRKRLDKIADERSKYKLIKEEAISYENELIKERKTSSVLSKDNVLGRNQEATQIIDRLLVSTTTNQSTALSIIPIVGIGGLGKTTLARLIYNADRTKEFFELRIWVHAVNLEVETLVEAILSSQEAENRNYLGDWDSKMKRAEEILQGKRYLIVLDDVWSEDWQKWDAFKPILQCSDNRESKIIVTTRSNRVPSTMGAETTHILQPLSDDDCLKLFNQKAFGSADAKDNLLASIGEEIVKKCRGVPLAANALGGMLHFEKGEAEWKKVRDSDLWELEEEGSGSQSENKIMSSLKLSYQHMRPPPLKLCFVYFSSYPKAFKLQKDELIQQWIAQNFIQAKDEVEALRIGDRYVNHLHSMSFLEQEEKEIDRFFRRDVQTYMKVHDLVYDLARWVAEDEVSLLDAKESGKDNAMECRYASVINYNEASKELGKALPRKVRALHFQDCTSLPKGIFSYTKCLRVLDFRSCSLDELPTSIYRLKQLRYLRLPNCRYKVDGRIGKLYNLIYLEINDCYSLSKIPNSIGSLQRLKSLKLADCPFLTSLPESLGDLVNLVTLDIKRCSIITLPASIGKLHNLIDLDLSFSDELLELPHSIGELQKLNSLKLYYCYNLGSLPESLFNLMELRTLDVRACAMLDQNELPKATCNMRHLEIQRDETLELFEFDTSNLMLHLIDGPQGRNVLRHVTDAKGINLKEGGGSIKSLSYHCGRNNKGRLVEAMLEALQPNKNLQELLIDHYGGSMFPSWMMSQMESFLPNLVKITLDGISNCEHLPVLGQLPKLEVIFIKNMPKIRRISEEELCGARNTTAGVASFPSLKRLELRHMDELEEWVTAAMAGDDGERGASLFPCLNWDCMEWATAAMAGDDGERGASLFPCLEHLIITRCPKLRRIHPCIPPSVKRLALEGMEDLEELVIAAMAGDDGERRASLFPCLEHLTIHVCPNLRRIHPCIPPSVRRLSLVGNVQHLLTLPDVPEILFLKHLTIHDDGMYSFPESIRRLTSLESLALIGCKSLTTLPEWLGELSQLQHLDILDCPLIDRLPQSIQRLTALKRVTY